MSSSPQASVQPITLDGDALLTALTASAGWLDRHAEAINALNVFPVPDGDTGLNMSLTLRSAVDEAARASSTSLAGVAGAMARGALMGARGNSGVILATLLRGISEEMQGREAADAQALGAALSAGAVSAYSAVASPVEGTILTVARAAGAAAARAAEKSPDLTQVLADAHAAARAAVAETPQQLAILRQAGVVDAGGEGYRVFLEGLLMGLRGESMDSDPVPVAMRADLTSLHEHADDFYGYCTEVLFRGKQLNMETVRSCLAELGGSILVVGDTDMLKVHVHTQRPGAVLDLATDLGEIIKVKIDNMQLQHDAFAALGAPSPAHPETPQAPAAGTAVVAVVLGEGFRSIFESFGAVVVACSRTMNASVGEIAQAIASATREDVIVLPNDPNVVHAARQAAKMAAERSVEVLPTSSMPQGIAAALALNPDATAVENLPSLASAAGRCRTISIVRAVREAQIGQLEVKTGSLLGFLDENPAATGTAFRDVLASVLERVPDNSHELATIYLGTNADRDTAEGLAELLAGRADAVEVTEGGQPHFDYIIALE